MSSFLRSLKFAWDYFVRGKHRIDARDWRAKLDWHDDPLVGRYVRTAAGTWWTDTVLKNLGYEVRLGAPGQGPTADQMASFETLAGHIPDIVSDANLEPMPKDDGWGNAAPPFDISTALVRGISMKPDGGYYLIFDVDSDSAYMLTPGFEISPDYTFVSADWSA